MIKLIIIFLLFKYVFPALGEHVELDKSSDSNDLGAQTSFNYDHHHLHDSLVRFLQRVKSSKERLKSDAEDDPSKKQTQMVSSLISSSNLIFGAKTHKNNEVRPIMRDAVLDMQSVKRTYSGYNEDETSAVSSNKNIVSVPMKKWFNLGKNSKSPITCYFVEPKQITCLHKRVMYKIQLPKRDITDDEIGRIVESIFKSVEIDKQNSKAKALVKDKQNKQDRKKFFQSKVTSSISGSTVAESAAPHIPVHDEVRSIYAPWLVRAAQAAVESTEHQYPGITVPPSVIVKPDHPGIPVSTANIEQPAIVMNKVNQHVPGIVAVAGSGAAKAAHNAPPGSGLVLTLGTPSPDNRTEEEKMRNYLGLLETNGYAPAHGSLFEKEEKGKFDGLSQYAQSLSDNKRDSIQLNPSPVSLRVLKKRHGRGASYSRRVLTVKHNTAYKEVGHPGDKREEVSQTMEIVDDICNNRECRARSSSPSIFKKHQLQNPLPKRGEVKNVNSDSYANRELLAQVDSVGEGPQPSGEYELNAPRGLTKRNFSETEDSSHQIGESKKHRDSFFARLRSKFHRVANGSEFNLDITTTEEAADSRLLGPTGASTPSELDSNFPTDFFTSGGLVNLKVMYEPPTATQSLAEPTTDAILVRKMSKSEGRKATQRFSEPEVRRRYNVPSGEPNSLRENQYSDSINLPVQPSHSFDNHEDSEWTPLVQQEVDSRQDNDQNAPHGKLPVGYSKRIINSPRVLYLPKPTSAPDRLYHSEQNLIRTIPEETRSHKIVHNTEKRTHQDRQVKKFYQWVSNQGELKERIEKVRRYLNKINRPTP